ncbi:MAG TPA: hypothetical protein VF111_15740, partial [Thermoanaerobaculia bacterium]
YCGERYQKLHCIPSKFRTRPPERILDGMPTMIRACVLLLLFAGCRAEPAETATIAPAPLR